jgi:hypothetical protein
VLYLHPYAAGEVLYWLVAGRSLDMPDAGDYIATEIGLESIIVVRQADGGVRGLLPQAFIAPRCGACSTTRSAATFHWIGGVAWEEVRWPNPVRGGDTLRARAEALSKRVSGKDRGRGIVKYRYTLLNESDNIVFACRSINLVAMRP